MPNVKGGKNYKKSKNTPDGPIFVEAEPDQLHGRIVRNLGNSNMIVYCSDNKRRICHIRGGIRKKMWLNVGDIVLVSVREFVSVAPGEFERGDILTKYDPCWFGRLKKTEGFNLRLFMDLEKLSDTSEGWNSSAILTGITEDDDVFERGGSGASSASDDDSEAEPASSAAATQPKKRYDATATSTDDDFNIDDI